MLYIVTALKPEAQAFVDKYRLKKNKLQNYTLFQNKNIKLIISGIGVSNARLATQTLINNFDITDDDIYLNVGICAAPKSHSIGELIEVGEIIYKDTSYLLGADKQTLTCKDEEVASEQATIVDMESYGFYDAVFHNPAIKKFHILKVVSDHFEPKKVTKEGTKSLLFNVIDDINSITFD
ncbi:hypothetical protein [Sulfurimonas autotrophica]|uniref:Nucleoside phosphorylase domain-containing protein n=1 Tax=Sulfurimonas autotrophica (strain ATCC BAA-671 / DSM 16294 / JCM 11897 / OK10) TaxID=563040 RepID=E0URH4_SULAO|nr:hypothetical protein [Sulfurimonas autotrophica]ADN10060.1 conserved hypothetical protein [Sulfurimonas autotrophica DSM 16294]